MQTQSTSQATPIKSRTRPVVVAIVASAVIATIEIAIAWLLKLESLFAEGVHTLLDGIDSVIVLIAVILAARPADRSHQYGHGKFEAVGAAIEGTFLIFAAIGIGYRGIDSLLHNRTPEAIPGYVCVAMIAAAVIYWFVSAYLMRVADETHSPAIRAEAIHLRSHIYITGGIAVGLLVGSLGNWLVIDTLLALGVAACLARMALHIFRDVFDQFTDAALPPSEIDLLGQIVDRFSDSFVEVHGLRTRRSGVERQIEMHLVVMPTTTVADAHALSHEIEDAIVAEWQDARVIVHTEPLNMGVDDYKAQTEGQPRVRTNDESPEEREFLH